MPAAENPKVGGCYIWVISLLLFVCTISGAIFLVLYMTENESTPSTFWYPIVGVSLVCLPWFFWLLTFLYRIISRSFGFRFICFNPFGSGYPDDEIAPSANGGGSGGGLGLGTSVVANTGSGDSGEGKIENGNENGESRDPTQPGSPRRVHFGGVVILGEENEDENGKRDSPRPSTSSSSSSSSSAPTSMQSNESEIPLRLAMAS